MATCVRYASAGQRRECGRMRCNRTPAVGTWPSAARTVLGWQEGERTCVVRAAEAKEVNISEGSCVQGPSLGSLRDFLVDSFCIFTFLLL